MFSTVAMREAVCETAWLRAMLQAEAALGRATARAGAIPPGAAEAIGQACLQLQVDAGALGDRAIAAGTPVAPLVEALRAALPAEAAAWVHFGATSQDILDTAMMLIARRALLLLLEDLTAVAAECARLAEAHRETVMAGRTLLQQAVPTTFGLKAASWLISLVEAGNRLAELRDTRLAAQVGGAAGTLAALGPQGLAVARFFAEELGLPEPPLPWQTNRTRIAEIAAGVAIAGGALAKIALDLRLLAQGEVAEAAEGREPGRGRSSAMPQKHNPVASVAVEVCARQARVWATLLLEAQVQEHERAAGGWQSEWQAWSGLFLAASGAAGRLRDALAGLRVDAGRMRANLAASGGWLMAEALVTALTPLLGPGPARARVDKLAASDGRSLRNAVLADPELTALFADGRLNQVLEPANYLGSAPALIDRALAAYRDSRLAARA